MNAETIIKESGESEARKEELKKFFYKEKKEVKINMDKLLSGICGK